MECEVSRDVLAFLEFRAAAGVWDFFPLVLYLLGLLCVPEEKN